MTLTAATGTNIHYTTDGADPSEASALVTGPITVSQPLVLKARAYQPGWTPSATSSASYVFDTAGPTIVPTLSPPPNPAGWSNTPVTISFECSDAATVASCPATVTLSQDGAGQLLTVTAQDALGNENSMTVTVKSSTGS